jgi:molybdopterin converting factor small subunit
MGRQRGSTLEAITVAELLDSIPEAAREELETCLNKDLRGAIVTTTTPIVDEDGRIYFDEIALRLEDGREVAIVPEMRGMCPWLVLEIHDGYNWRGMTVAEDYAEELEELTAAPWRPEPDTVEEARL